MPLCLWRGKWYRLEVDSRDKERRSKGTSFNWSTHETMLRRCQVWTQEEAQRKQRNKVHLEGKLAKEKRKSKSSSLGDGDEGNQIREEEVSKKELWLDSRKVLEKFLVEGGERKTEGHQFFFITSLPSKDKRTRISLSLLARYFLVDDHLSIVTKKR